MTYRTVKDVAKEYRCSEDSVLRRIKQGKLKATKPFGAWLIDPESLDALVEESMNRDPVPQPGSGVALLSEARNRRAS